MISRVQTRSTRSCPNEIWLSYIARCRIRQLIGAYRLAIDGRRQERELAVLHVQEGVRIGRWGFDSSSLCRWDLVRGCRRRHGDGSRRALPRVRRGEEAARASGLSLLYGALLVGIDGRLPRSRHRDLRVSDRAAEIAR